MKIASACVTQTVHLDYELLCIKQQVGLVDWCESLLSHTVCMHPVLTVPIKQHLRTKEREAPIHSLVGCFLSGRGESSVLWEHFLSSSHRVGKLLCPSHTSSRTGTHSFIRPLLNETMDRSVTITLNNALKGLLFSPGFQDCFIHGTSYVESVFVWSWWSEKTRPWHWSHILL